jgi:Domain of unknown function (DUF4367)
MIDLERSLIELAQRLEVPGADQLVGDVVARLGEPVRRRVGRTAVRLAFALLIVAGLVAAILPGPRRVVARWLGFDSVRIETGVTLPASTTSVAATIVTVPTTSSAGTLANNTTSTTVVDLSTLDLGDAVSIDQAMLRTGLPDPTPALLGAPQSIHVVQPPTAGQIVEVYAPSDLVPPSKVTGVGALISVWPGKIEEGYFTKGLGEGTTLTSVDVGGSPGYWIEGQPHEVFFSIDGEAQANTMRLATNTLLWQRDGYVYRIEADITAETALRIAASVG